MIQNEGTDPASAHPRTEYWRSLEELAGVGGLDEVVHDEFLPGVIETPDPMSRRQFVSLMGAGLALAGLAGCARPPREKILPYVRRPEEIIPGRPLFYATAMTLGGYAVGLLVESHQGRPVKIEGNPLHPSSKGATDAIGQAAILGLYDPGRSRAVTYLGRPSSWDRTLMAIGELLQKVTASQGAGLRILTETVTSPTLLDLMKEIHQRFPAMRWHQYEPINRDEVMEGTRIAFGQELHPQARMERAEVIVSLDADFLSEGPDRLVAAREFAERRRVWSASTPSQNRLYVIESTLTITGSRGDHRLALPAHKMESFARHLARLLGEELRRSADRIDSTALDLLGRLGRDGGDLSDAAKRWAAAIARDLTQRGRRGNTLLLAGQHQPAVVHALCHIMNHALNNTDRTVVYRKPIESRPLSTKGQPQSQLDSMKELVRDMHAGQVDGLLILGGNPVYTAPADLDFAGALNHVGLRVHLGLYQDETARLCHWHIPEAHFLESWGDARGHDGTATIQQPLIAPLYEGARTALEVLVTLTNEPTRSAHELVQGTWRKRWGREQFQSRWEQSIHDGLVHDDVSPNQSVKLQAEWAERVNRPGDTQTAEIVFRMDPFLYDGRFATNNWLQELPRPLTRLSWDNVALLSPATAERLGIQRGRGGFAPDLHAPGTDLIEVSVPGRVPVEVPAWILPGHPDDTVTVHLGYGRTRVGAPGAGVGFNAYLLRSSEAPWFQSGVTLKRTGRRTTVACVQHHHLTQNRDLIRRGEVTATGKLHLVAGKAHAHPPEPPHTSHDEHKRHSLSMYPPKEYRGYKWGMVIDLTTCIGCQACVAACQAENNIPTVGRTEVIRGREMHWLRIDRYFSGAEQNPQVHLQPLPCMHCETAPCEPVCPVAATVHSDEGLNDMVYNRCVGTRYCSNNCPYKVRRFNFLQYSDWKTETLRLGRNPDVSVRSRGVMEKCTYCVQRINTARIEAEKAGRTIQDGDVLTACQAVCPTSTIYFGDLNAKSTVAKAQQSELNYGLLAELNTVPRTTYLGEVRNPNPDPDLGA